MDNVTGQLPDLQSCNAIMHEWSQFGIEGLVIGGLIFLVGLVLWWQKAERESWQMSLDDLNETIRRICLSGKAKTKPDDLDDGK